jgi:hypothetical protein
MKLCVLLDEEGKRKGWNAPSPLSGIAAGYLVEQEVPLAAQGLA